MGMSKTCSFHSGQECHVKLKNELLFQDSALFLDFGFFILFYFFILGGGGGGGGGFRFSTTCVRFVRIFCLVKDSPIRIRTQYILIQRQSW